MPRIRTEPEDFVVEELSLFPPSGDGPFSYLWVEKKGANTDDVVRALARSLELDQRQVGYAGRKDRRAVTRQWFSVPASVEQRLTDLDLAFEGMRVLDSRRHQHRLSVGQLAGNRFQLRVRDVDPGSAQRVRARVDDMARRGMPNRYGRQRFGRDGRNAERGLDILRKDRLRGERRTGWLMVSALQSAVFNAVLERRASGLDEVWRGDVVLVHASGEQRWADDRGEDRERARAFEVSATGPIFGTKMKRPRGQAAKLEAEVLEEFGLPPLGELRPPRGVRMYGDRRSLRVRPRNLDCRYRADDRDLHLSFELPPGSYATILLDELFPAGYDEGPMH